MSSPLAFLLPIGLVFPNASTGIKGLQAVRTETSLQVDGRLDEAAWSRAPILRDFTQLTPLLGKESQKRTEVRVLYDDRFLYVGARMHHEPGSTVVTQVHRRDQSSASDWFAVFLDSAHDHRSAFSFMVNASGVQRDGVHFEDGSEDWSWDGVWDSEVQVDAGGWTAELRIPLSSLRFHRGDGPRSWGANFARRDEGQVREASYWYAPPRGENAWVSRFHHLEGLDGLNPRPRREWIPYASLQRKFETAQAFDDRGWELRGGLDAHLGLNSHSQLDLTLRPDFGQVEVDQAVLNLSTVETFFPEKRPFFLEGMDIFQVPGARLFYSRRIGKGLGRPPYSPDLTDWPKAPEIAAAGKYTAKFPGGLALGLLGAGLEAAEASYVDDNGQTYRKELSPYTTAGVIRATQALDDQGSYLGAFASFLRQADSKGRSAGVGALDGVWKSKDRRLSLDAVYAHSESGTRSQLEEGDFLRLHVLGAWGQGWSVDGNAFSVSRLFNPNDLGYLDRPDRKGFTFDLDRRWDLQRGVFRNPFLRFTYCDFRDQAGKPYTRYFESWGKTEFINEWAAFAGGGEMAPVFDDRELRTFRDPQKTYLRLPRAQWTFVGFDSPPNRPWVVNTLWHHVWREGGPKNEYQLTQTYKPMPRLEFRLETVYTSVAGEWHWFETQGSTPIVGTRKLSQLDQIVRASYAFSPRMTVQLFSQWLAANWAFRDLRTSTGLEPTPATPQSPTASSERLWNLNLITRWEFRPGSSFYLVYTHGAFSDLLINDRASMTPRRDLALMHHLPSDDALQVKVSWMFH